MRRNQVPDPLFFTTGTHSKLGELCQGMLPENGGTPFLISGSVRSGPFRAEAKFIPDKGPLRVEPGEKSKAQQAIEIFAERAHRNGFPLPTGRIELNSTIPVGGGLGSSSADISVVLRVLMKITGYHLSDRELYRIYGMIERSDPVDLAPNRLILARQTIGEFVDLGPMPMMTAIAAQVVDTPVETAAVAHLDKTRKKYVRHYESMIRDIASGDPHRIGNAITQSSSINQDLPALGKPFFDEFKSLKNFTGAIGVGCTHTGQFLSLVFHEDHPDLMVRIADCRQTLSALGLKPLLFRY